jgi:hypothetical protein
LATGRSARGGVVDEGVADDDDDEGVVVVEVAGRGGVFGGRLKVRPSGC